jgi:hypothetical protein
MLEIKLVHYRQKGDHVQRTKYSLSKATQETFITGDWVEFIVRSNRTGYLYLLHLGTSGNMHVLFPHKGLKNGVDNKLAGQVKQKIRFPNPKHGKIEVQGKPGKEYFSVLVTSKPLFNVEEVAQTALVQKVQAPKQPKRKTTQVGLCNQDGRLNYQTCQISANTINVLVNNERQIRARDFVFVENPPFAPQPQADLVALPTQDLKPQTANLVFIRFYLHHK